MRTLTGKIVSIKMSQTAVVLVDRLIKHPMYQKQLRRSKKYHAHHEMKLSVGEEVKIQEIRPMSKTKTWKVIEVVNKNGTA